MVRGGSYGRMACWPFSPADTGKILRFNELACFISCSCIADWRRSNSLMAMVVLRASEVSDDRRAWPTGLCNWHNWGELAATR